MNRSSNPILAVLKLIRARELVQRLFRNPPRNTGTLDPRKVKRSLHPQAWTVDGFQLLTIPGKSPAPKHLIYLPGGAYLLEATPYHRKFVEQLVKLTGFSVTIIDYPKAPEHSFRATHELVGKSYQVLRDRYPEAEFCLGGDSAGGGLALAFLQTLRNQGADTIPKQSVLISPWLDLSLSHPQIPDYESRDPILPLAGLIDAAKRYSGEEDLRNPLLSPLYGDLSRLGKITLIFGSEEIFYPDCLELIEKANPAPGTELEWEIGKNQVHAWPIFPFSDSKRALERIAAFLLGE